MTNGEHILSQIPSDKYAIDYLATRDNPKYAVFMVDHEWWQAQQKRGKSLSMNAYMWQLCDKIARAKAAKEKVAYTKEEIYRMAVHEVGVFDDSNAILTEALEAHMDEWNRKGVGWFCETFGVVFYDIYGHEYQPVRHYYGSSTYNAQELRRLTDWVVEEAKAENVPTATPDELAELEMLWEKAHGVHKVT